MTKRKIVVVIPTCSDEVDTETISRKCGAEVVIDVIDNKEGVSLTELYGMKLDEHKADDTIIVFMHDDVIVTSPKWGEKLLEIFNTTEYGIVGVAGSEILGNECVWWSDLTKTHGMVMHSKDGSCWISEFGKTNDEPLYDVCVVDGLFMAVDPNRVKNGFDKDFGGFDFYDISFCADNFLSGVGIAVTTEVKLVHGSVGEMKPNWYVNQKKAIEKYKDKLPITI